MKKSVLFNIHKKISSFMTAQQNLIPKGADSEYAGYVQRNMNFVRSVALL